MPIPQLLFLKIPDIAHHAARTDRFVLGSRNPDESYGKIGNEKGRITLSLAALQCHAQKGMPLSSPRLKGIVDWLNEISVESPHFLTAPLRLAASWTIKTDRSLVLDDLHATYGLISRLNRSIGIEKPILYMLSLETLLLYDYNVNHCDEIKTALEKLKLILSSEYERPSVKSYAAYLMITYGNSSHYNEAVNYWDGLFGMQKNGAWEECIIETAYVVINSKCLPIKIKEGRQQYFAEAIDFLREKSPSGVPQREFIRYTPSEIGTEDVDRQVYAAAVTTRALVDTIGMPELGCLLFAHASWKSEQDEITAMARNVEEELVVSKKKNDELTKEINLVKKEVQQNDERHYNDEKNQRNSLFIMGVGCGLSFLALLILSINLDTKYEQIISLAGSVASLGGIIAVFIRKNI